MQILVTGGTGYIGSHTVVELLNNNYDVVIIDNLCNSEEKVLDKIKKITGKEVKFYEADVCDKDALREIFKENEIKAVIHFAGLKAVGESVEQPLKYYRNNIDSTLSLVEVMNEFNCKKIVFSSSATVYGSPKTLPIKEDFPLSSTNPYGSTKLFIEQILRDVYTADNNWSIALLRYFNPIGAHESGLLGENPKGIPNNLMPYIIKVAVGELPELRVFGNDYPTEDGTGVRDYIHVVDLAKGHIKAIEKVLSTKEVDCYNLGTGKGYSVLDLIKTFENVNGVKINYRIVERRPGDIAECYADPTYAQKKLGWTAEKGIIEMCRDSYNYILTAQKEEEESEETEETTEKTETVDYVKKLEEEALKAKESEKEPEIIEEEEPEIIDIEEKQEEPEIIDHEEEKKEQKVVETPVEELEEDILE